MKPDISIILTGHREGVLIGATLNSAFRAINYALEKRKLNFEFIVVLDNADEITKNTALYALSTQKSIQSTLLETKEGDPGQARNRGIEVANGEFSTFLDGDDLWSFNWLLLAYEAAKANPKAVYQSHCNAVFGSIRNYWFHVDSESPLFDPLYLNWSNYWDAMSFAKTEIYRKYPFKKNDLKLGFGHEDWHWSVLTYNAGVAHKPVHNTVHFKRRRQNSQMSLVEKGDGVVWPE